MAPENKHRRCFMRVDDITRLFYTIFLPDLPRSWPPVGHRLPGARIVFSHHCGLLQKNNPRPPGQNCSWQGSAGVNTTFAIRHFLLTMLFKKQYF